MMPYRTITVFSDLSDLNQGMVPLVASILAHGAASGIIGFAIMYTPGIATYAPGERYIVRHLELDPAKPRGGRPAGEANDDAQHIAAIARLAVDESIAVNLQGRVEVPAAKAGSQVLIQPDIPLHLLSNERIHVPAFVMWKPSRAPVKIIAPSEPEEMHAHAMPSLNAPNEELVLTNLALPASDTPQKIDPLRSGTTSPVVVNKNDGMQKPPVSGAQETNKPTTATILSVSDYRSNDKSAILPPISEAPGSGPRTELPHEQAATNASRSQDHLGGYAGDTDRSSNSRNAMQVQGLQSSGAGVIDRSGSGQGEAAGLFDASQGSATVITVARDGRFGAVVVGTSLEDRFPEMEGFWGGRLIYTVYLHVGLAQSWILQYSLPRSAEAVAAGNIAHLEAPWPYSIVRPDLTPGSIDADALIVNGFVDENGRFESLKAIFPSSFPQSEFVLHCLQQWQFRPAAQGGHSTRVEVMLIIPDP